MYLPAKLFAALTGFALTLAQTIQQTGDIERDTSAQAFTYVGCYEDVVNDDIRTLPDAENDLVNNDPTTCADFCQGYAYFGVEYS